MGQLQQQLQQQLQWQWGKRTGATTAINRTAAQSMANGDRSINQLQWRWGTGAGATAMAMGQLQQNSDCNGAMGQGSIVFYIAAQNVDNSGC
jgi:hypothetical protein